MAKKEHPVIHSALTRETVRPDGMRVFAFVDTNVLLHYRFFRDVDSAEELGADEATLVFAPVVVEELDEQKWAGTRRARARAKKVLRALKGLGLSATPGKMRSGVEILALDEEPTDALFVRHRLQPRISDDRLLASVLAFAASQISNAAIKVLTAAGVDVHPPASVLCGPRERHCSDIPVAGPFQAIRGRVRGCSRNLAVHPLKQRRAA